MRHGELFAGVGALGMAVSVVFGSRLGWVAEFDAALLALLARPGVPALRPAEEAAA